MKTCVFNCDEAKKIDLVDYLASLGFQPKKIRGKDHWFVSPFRAEYEPSFKINRHLNWWYDHGSGDGGTIIDFCMQYHHCEIPEVLERLNNYFSFHQPNILADHHTAPDPIPDKSRIRILDAQGIETPRLIHYLQRRRIPLDIAARHCQEVHYELYGKRYYAIGFRNNSEGYELRNEFFKASSSPKDLTLICHGEAKIISVFEGFFDFLSWLTIYHNQPRPLTDFLVLNTLAYFDKALPILDKYPAVQLYLDGDAAGRRHTSYALELHPRYQDCSYLYQNYKDLNDWLMYPGHLEKLPRSTKIFPSPGALSRPPNPD